MIYTNGQSLLTRQQLRKIPIPERPDAGPLWKGVGHGDLADTIVGYVKKLGFGVAQEHWYCNPNQSALFGAVDIDTSGTDFAMDVGTPSTFSLGVRHDNAGRYAVTFVIGARIFVCSNGVFSGDFILKHKHYTSLDLYDFVSEGVEEYVSEMDSVQSFIHSLQAIPLTDRDAHHLIIQASKHVNWSYLNYVRESWHSPQYEEFEERNLWSLYNCFTSMAKQLSPPRQYKLLKGLKTVVEEFTQPEER